MALTENDLLSGTGTLINYTFRVPENVTLRTPPRQYPYFRIFPPGYYCHTSLLQVPNEFFLLENWKQSSFSELTNEGEGMTRPTTLIISPPYAHYLVHPQC